jgi:multiple sugar transport system permease protein
VTPSRGYHGPGKLRSIVAVSAVLPFTVPLLWLVAGALKPPGQFYTAPPTILPDPPSLEAISSALRLVDAPRLAANSLLLAALNVVGTVASGAIVGFAFATLPARGRRPLFGLLVATILVPASVTLVPQYILFSRLGWVGTYLPLVVPQFFGSAFAIFLFRQWFRGLPANLFESAELDGANPFQQLRYVALPLARPVIAVIAVFAFVGSWNDFLGPLLYLRTPETFTVSLGLAAFQGVYVNQVQQTMALSLLALLPVVAVFALAQRWLIQGIATGGVRG